MRSTGRKRKTAPRKKSSAGRKIAFFGVGLISLLGVWGALRWTRPDGRLEERVTFGRGELTFNKHIAPILFQNCSECHRPGQSAPFSLLTYADAKKHAADIADVVARRYMPPWLPANAGQFLDERRLTPSDIAIIKQWVAEGAVEGRASDLPAAPHWRSDWQLGAPDMVLTMPEPYVLPGEGRDVYRNFIIPTRLTRPRFVRALELRPGSKVVHHAFVRFDRTGQCRVLDEAEPGPGFGGMETPATAETPPGHFSGWVPGASPIRAPEGLTWQLPAGADFVLLLHMQPSGKPETISPQIGLYFTEAAPTNTAAILNLQTFNIDIPAGTSNYTTEESMTLPVDAELLAVKPHAHYLGKRLQGLATLPDGTTLSLLDIPQWDFNWQTDYRYKQPVSVPAGTVLHLQYSYDNSTNNARNPHRPPVRVQYGLQSFDEMGELGFQILPRRQTDFAQLQSAVRQYQLKKSIELSRVKLKQNPNDGEAAADLGKFLYVAGEKADSELWLRRSILLRPGSADTLYSLGIVLLDAGKFAEAEQVFMEVVRINPAHYKARNNAGLSAFRQGKLDQAEAHFREVLRFRPDDTFAQNNLDLVLQTRRAKH